MPAFLLAMMPFLGYLLGALVFRIAIGIGFGIASYIGLSILTGNLVVELSNAFTGLPAGMAQIAYIMQLDKSVNLIVSALIARMTLKGMTAAGVYAAVRWTQPA